ncbi:MAG: hypothetical protein JRF23_07285 [Deltaproteobacteria bacterium]|nr:hypothetical protein [Deltaproteobacteria bacterium]
MKKAGEDQFGREDSGSGPQEWRGKKKIVVWIEPNCQGKKLDRSGWIETSFQTIEIKLGNKFFKWGFHHQAVLLFANITY